jgi:TATA-box binding protein (TBP) (component of TFIID and TFIIIB)
MASIPSDVHISTITAIGKSCDSIDLEKLYQEISFDIYKTGNYLLQYYEYGKDKHDKRHRGTLPLKRGNKKLLTASRFDNQATVIMTRCGGSNTCGSLNIKLFNNGNFQITGLKHPDEGVDVMNELFQHLKKTGACTGKLEVTNYDVCLINCDFKVRYQVRRDVLYKTIVQEYNNDCSFEPCIYPGVKIRYFFNRDTKEANDNGICRCERSCSLKSKANICTKVTMSVFQSGCAIITGARSLEQLNTVHKYISRIMNKHEQILKKKQVFHTNNQKDLCNLVETIRIKRSLLPLPLHS